MKRVRNRMLLLLAASSSGVVFQLVGGCTSLVNNFNPCGVLLNCDATQYAFQTSDIDGPGYYPDVDPFCTFPPFCTATQDPVFGLGG